MLCWFSESDQLELLQHYVNFIYKIDEMVNKSREDRIIRDDA